MIQKSKLNGTPRVDKVGGKYVAVIPLKKYEQGAELPFGSR